MTISRRTRIVLSGCFLAHGLGVAVCLAACSVQPTPAPSASEILTRAAQSMQDLKTVHFIIDRSGAPAYVDLAETIVFRRAEGDFSAPDRARAAVRVIGPALVAEVNVVSIGEQYWETNPFTGQWASYPGMGYNPARLFDPESGLVPFMRTKLTDVQSVGMETIEAGPAGKLYHLTAQAPGEPVMAMTADMVGRGRVLLDWWVAPATFRVIRMRITEPDTDAADPSVWVIDFDSFDSPVEIRPPAP